MVAHKSAAGCELGGLRATGQWLTSRARQGHYSCFPRSWFRRASTLRGNGMADSVSSIEEVPSIFPRNLREEAELESHLTSCLSHPRGRSLLSRAL